jgi:hypothetical protein
MDSSLGDVFSQPRTVGHTTVEAEPMPCYSSRGSGLSTISDWGIPYNAGLGTIMGTGSMATCPQGIHLDTGHRRRKR